MRTENLMSEPDRKRLIELLEQLGAESDAQALAAAREANRLVAAAGSSWRELFADDVEAEPVSERSPAATAGDQAGDLRIIEQLLARKDISDTLRNDLQEFRRVLGEGNLDQMDSDYIRALAKRLGI